MPPAPCVVIKIGGSLLLSPQFPRRMRTYLDQTRDERQLFIVGGGPATDFIRALDSSHLIGDNQSHHLALRALDLTAHILASLVPGLTLTDRIEDLESLWSSQNVPILAPRNFLQEVDAYSPHPLPETWSVTTDSIAARVASHLEARELRLLKSTSLGPHMSVKHAAASGLVDLAFPVASRDIPRIGFVNFRDDPPTTEYFPST